MLKTCLRLVRVNNNFTIYNNGNTIQHKCVILKLFTSKYRAFFYKGRCLCLVADNLKKYVIHDELGDNGHTKNVCISYRKIFNDMNYIEESNKQVKKSVSYINIKKENICKTILNKIIKRRKN